MDNVNTSEAISNQASTQIELGELIGTVKAVSEGKQIAIVVAAILLQTPLWFVDGFPAIAIIPIVGAIVLGAYFAMRKIPYFRSFMHVHSNGIELEAKGQGKQFLYESIESFCCKQTDHKQNGGYIGSKMDFTFDLSHPDFQQRYSCDFRIGSATHSLIDGVIARISEGVQTRLCAELESKGEIVWTNGVSLTMEGLKREDARFENGQTVRFEEIDEWRVEDNQLKVFKKDSAFPCFMFGNDTRNFIPMLAQFSTMLAYFKAADEKVSQEEQEQVIA
jgi:hypothetical protein